jgi:hypothetical protein
MEVTLMIATLAPHLWTVVAVAAVALLGVAYFVIADRF